MRTPLLTALLILAVIPPGCSSTQSQDQYEKFWTVDQFKNFVQVSPFADGEHWFLTQPLEYDIAETGAVITVPKGFVTDFASTPSIVWIFLPPWGEYGPPSVVHDYLYWDQGCKREEADAIYMIAMKEAGVGSIRRFFIDTGVWLFGSWGWRSNELLYEAKRVKIIPEEYFPNPKRPNITWKEHQEELYKRKVPPQRSPTTPGYCAAAQNR